MKEMDLRAPEETCLFCHRYRRRRSKVSDGKKGKEGKKGTNDVTQLLFPPQVIKQRFLNDRSKEGELRAEVVVVEVADVGELLD
jgi:hypothetical protein